MGPSQSSGGGGGRGRLEKVASYKPRSKQGREKEDWKRREQEKEKSLRKGEKRREDTAKLYYIYHPTIHLLSIKTAHRRDSRENKSKDLAGENARHASHDSKKQGQERDTNAFEVLHTTVHHGTYTASE